MSNLLIRIITGSIFGLLMIFGIMFSRMSLQVLFSIITALCVFEYLGLFRMRVFTRVVYAILSAFIIALGIFIDFQINHSIVSVFSILMLILALRELFVLKEKSFLYRFPSSLGVFYIILAFFTLVNLNVLESTLNGYIMLFYAIVWSADTFAYFSGRFLGKNKFWESISPKKTIEGLIGGLVGAAVVSLLLNHYFFHLKGGLVIVFIALLTALFTAFGDLVESKLKRNLEVKDSGNMLPGHGGILDRFDGVLLGAPVYYLLVQYL